jgi:hypothetical protein
MMLTPLGQHPDVVCAPGRRSPAPGDGSLDRDSGDSRTHRAGLVMNRLVAGSIATGGSTRRRQRRPPVGYPIEIAVEQPGVGVEVMAADTCLSMG